MTIQQALWSATQQLHTSTTPDLDAEVLLAAVLKKDRAFVFTYPEKKITPAQVHRFSRLITRRLHLEPIAYLLGHKEFFGLDFLVNRHVLVPRPETEFLVETVIKLMRGKTQPHIVDIGTGSGAIAISLKKHLPRAQVLASDTSSPALAMAKKNARHLHTTIQFKKGSLLSPFHKFKFDCIVSNPPYLTAAEMRNPQLTFEPKSALDGGPDGLDIYRLLIPQALAQLTVGGYVVMEIGSKQFPAVHRFTHLHLPSAKISCLKDYAHHNRVMIIQV